MQNFNGQSPYNPYFYGMNSIPGFEQYDPSSIYQGYQPIQPQYYPNQFNQKIQNYLGDRQFHPKQTQERANQEKPVYLNQGRNTKKRGKQQFSQIKDDAYLKNNIASNRNQEGIKPRKTGLGLQKSKNIQSSKIQSIQKNTLTKKQEQKKSSKKIEKVSDEDSISEDSQFESDQDTFRQRFKSLEIGRKEYNTQKAQAALLKHFNNDSSKVDQCLYECGLAEAQQRTLDRYQKNFLILKHLGFTKRLYHWQVLKTLQKNNNDLEETIQRLNKRVKVFDHDKNVQQILKDTIVNQVQTIPENCIVLIDGFNVVRTNKYLKNLTVKSDEYSKQEAILRLKTFVQTLKPGYLVLDKKFGDQQSQKQIQKKIGIELKKQKIVDVVYAEEGKKADDKIVEILGKMSKQERGRILLVTSDRLLIKECQDICGEEIQVIGGKNFITQCKLLIPQGYKHKILTGKGKTSEQF